MKGLRGAKLGEYLLTILVVVTLNFLLPRAMSGDPFLFLSGEEAGDIIVPYSEEQREQYLEFYGLNKPVVSQYFSYLSELCRGNLGFSLYYNAPVSSIILNRLVWTIFLVLAAVLFSTLIGVALGCISAWYREKWVDKSLYTLMITISEIPAFLLGLVLLFTLAAGLGLFPLSGAMTHFADYRHWWDKAYDILHHAFLPVTALVIARLGGMYLLSRNSMTTVLAKDYIRTAQAKGLQKKRIIYRHALKNALLPIVTRIFLSIGGMVGGAILVENVFAYPGLGLLMRQSVMYHDYPLIQGIFLVVTIFVLLANFTADLVYGKLDPRVGQLGVAEK